MKKFTNSILFIKILIPVILSTIPKPKLYDISAQAILKQLKERNIQVCIDDFGTGYSSLSYLYRFPVDVLKIDRSFTDQIRENCNTVELVTAMINLAVQLNMEVVAEGLETKYQLEYLRSLKCGFAQGYFFSKPLDIKSIDNLLTQNMQW